MGGHGRSGRSWEIGHLVHEIIDDEERWEADGGPRGKEEDEPELCEHAEHLRPFRAHQEAIS